MFVTHIVSLCVGLRQTQAAVGSHTGITVVCMAVTLTSGQMTERGEDRTERMREREKQIVL